MIWRNNQKYKEMISSQITKMYQEKKIEILIEITIEIEGTRSLYE